LTFGEKRTIRKRKNRSGRGFRGGGRISLRWRGLGVEEERKTTLTTHHANLGKKKKKKTSLRSPHLGERKYKR